MAKLSFRRSSLVLLGIVAAATALVAQQLDDESSSATSKITSVSKITTS
jgi:hypothetical protein